MIRLTTSRRISLSERNNASSNMRLYRHRATFIDCNITIDKINRMHLNKKHRIPRSNGSYLNHVT